MWNNQKQQKMFSLMSNLQTYYHFKLDFQKVDQHTGGKWLIHGTKRRRDNQLQSLDPPCRISLLIIHHISLGFKGLRLVLEGFVVPMHEGACETGSQIPRALARGYWRTVLTSPIALGQQTPTDRS